MLVVFLFSACVKDEFDAPPTEVLPDIEANTTVKELTDLAVNGAITEITEDLVVRAIVTGNDEDGNFFRELVVQDETAGMYININLTGAYNFLPIGREIFIKAKGLYIIRDNEVPKLGGYIAIENGVEELGDIQDLNDHILRGARNQFVNPTKLSNINEAGFEHLAMLVEFENVEFAFPGETFADAFGQTTQNKTLKDCTGNEIDVRTSGFATFAGQMVPGGNGSLVGVYSQFNGSGQIFIRNPNDTESMTGMRCDGSTGTGGTGNEEQLSIEEVKNLYLGGAGSAPEETKIIGVVISDRDNGNIVPQNLHIQDGDHGIIVRFQQGHNFSLNDRIEVVISNQELSEFNGGLQVNNVPNTNATFIETAASPTPRVATIADILANNDLWESTLVQIENVTITGDATYGFNDISDGTGTMDLYASSFASFSETAIPNGTVTLTGILSQFNDPQITMRNIGDVVPDGGGPGGGDPEQISIEDVRGLFNSGSTAAPADRFIKGIVISDFANMNINNQNLVIQDGEFGVVVRFTDPHSFELGTELEVDISGMELSEFNGLLQVNNVAIASGTALSSGNSVTPREATIAEILANAEAWESTLVRIEDVLITGSATYDGNTTVSDVTGSLPMFTRSAAPFSGTAVPNDEVIMTAVVSQFNDTQVFIRNINDIEE